MNGGSSPRRSISEDEGTEMRSRRACTLTDDVRGIVLDEGPDLRGVATIDDPTGLCVLVEPFLDFRAEFICGTGPPVRFPMEGIQVDMRYIQQLGEPSTQRRLPPVVTQCQVASRAVEASPTISYLSSACTINRNTRGKGGGGTESIHFGFLFAQMGSWRQRTAVANDQYLVPPRPITNQRFRRNSGGRGGHWYV